MAAGEHDCHSATISPQVLHELVILKFDASKQPGVGKPDPAPSGLYGSHATPERLQEVAKVDPFRAADVHWKLASTDIDYLANNGAELQRAIEAEPVMKQRLEDALQLFTGGLLESKAKIEKVFSEISVSWAYSAVVFGRLTAM